MSETCRNGHPRTPQNTYIRPSGERSGERECKVCRKTREREYRNRIEPNRDPVSLQCVDCGNPIEWTRRTGRRPTRCPDCAAEHEFSRGRKYMAEPKFRRRRNEEKAQRDKLAKLGERKRQELEMLTLAKRSGELGKLYTQTIRAQQTLDRQPYAGREHNALLRDAMERLNEVEHALARLLLVDDDKARSAA